MKNILVLCTGNSRRSIMGEALINRYLGSCYDVKAYSAGTKPTGKVNENALYTLKEYCLETLGYSSKHIDSLKDIKFDLVVTVCGGAKEECPMFAGDTKVIHVGFEDPDGKDFEAFKETFNQMRETMLPRIKEELNL